MGGAGRGAARRCRQRRVEGVEDGERRQGRVGSGLEPHDRLGDDPQRALRADEEAGEVVAGHPLGGAVAGAHDLTPGQHDLQRLDPVGGDTVLHAAQAARVGRDVAADRARLPRRRVGPVEEARIGGHPLEGGVDDAGADDGIPLEDVDLVDLVERLDVEHDAPLRGDRAARPRRARPLGHDGGAGRLRVLEDSYDVAHVTGAHDGEVLRRRA